MSLTRPTPLQALLASTLAASSARCASSTAVSNPKHLSICGAGNWHSSGRVYHGYMGFHKPPGLRLPQDCRFFCALRAWAESLLSSLRCHQHMPSQSYYSKDTQHGSAQRSTSGAAWCRHVSRTECGGEQAKSGYQQNVIVNGLGDTHNAALHVLLLALLLDGVRRGVPSVPAHCNHKPQYKAGGTPPRQPLQLQQLSACQHSAQGLNR